MNFLLTDWFIPLLTYLITYLLCLQTNMNWQALWLEFSLFNVTLSKDLPFRQLQPLQHLHYGSTKAYIFGLLCAPVPSPLSRRWITVCALWLQCKTWVSAVLAEVLFTLFFTWNVTQNVRRTVSETKHSDTLWSSNTLTFKSIVNIVCVLAGLIIEMLLMVSSIYNTV